jgi:hypothetical protein
LRSAPDFDLVASFGQNMAPPNGGVIIDMLAAVHTDCLVPLDDADLIIVHVASPISAMGIEFGCGKGVSRFF